jgi:alkylation response protein AidB-like acyl-CoA dehydrogenase
MIDAFARAAELDAYLGRPRDANSIMREQDSLKWDAEGTFPQPAVDALDEWGLQRAYVPKTLGGDLVDVLPAMLQIRQVARRDITTAVAHGKTFLGSLCSWLAGGDSADLMSSIVLSGSAVSWGLTERGRGSDILRSATRYTGTKGGRLTGGKWPINNATRGRAMCVLVRTRDETSPRSLSLALVDKNESGSAGVSYAPKVRTHGVRGADISGIDWNDVAIPNNRFIGQEGQGLELVLRALQLTRPTCTALSLGGADQAVDEVLRFLRHRRLYGRGLGALPKARADAGAVIADSLVAEATAFVGARHVVELTEEMALVSALVKYVVPATVDSLFRDATGLLGARSQLIGVDGAGRFEKATRDSRVVGIFDGNSIVNLQVIINEFPSVTKSSGDQVDLDKMLSALDAAAPTNGLMLERLRLMTRRGSTLMTAVPQLCAAVASGVDPPLERTVEEFARGVADLMDDIRLAERTMAPGGAHFDLARRLAEAFAGACCLTVWSSNSAPTNLARNQVWLAAALTRVSLRMGLHVREAAVNDSDLYDLCAAAGSAGEPVTLFEGWVA